MAASTFSSLHALRTLNKKMGSSVEFSEDVSALGTPIEAGDLTFPNRIAIQPMEGADATHGGEATEYTRDRYLRYAVGGAGLIWFEACSLDFPEARSHDSMLVLSEKTLPRLRKIVNDVKKESSRALSNLGVDGRAILVLQLSHAGRYRGRKSRKSPALAYRFRELDQNMGISEETGRIVTDQELSNLRDAFVKGAETALEAGFDAVDVKACHGYLLNSLLSSFRREGEFGGDDLRKRSKFMLDTIESIRKQTGCPVTSRFSAYDGVPYPYGFGTPKEKGEWKSPYEKLPDVDLSEPIVLLQHLKALGVEFANVSMGDPYYGPFVTRPFDVKAPGGRDPIEHPIESVSRHFLIVERLKEAVPGMVFVGSGYSWLRQFGINAASYNVENNRVDIAGWGRLALAFSDFPKTTFTAGVLPQNKVCVTCSGCTRLLRAGFRVGCVIRNPEEFRETMQKLREMGK